MKSSSSSRAASVRSCRHRGAWSSRSSLPDAAAARRPILHRPGAGAAAGAEGGRGRGGGGGAQPVVTAKVTQKDVPVDIAAVGNVEAYTTISVRSQVTGQLQQAFFHEGDVVKKGDKLFAIDPRPLEAALQQARGQPASRDQALLNQAEAQLARDAANAEYQQLAAERQAAARRQGHRLEGRRRAGARRGRRHAGDGQGRQGRDREREGAARRAAVGRRQRQGAAQLHRSSDRRSTAAPATTP